MCVFVETKICGKNRMRKQTLLSAKNCRRQKKQIQRERTSRNQQEIRQILSKQTNEHKFSSLDRTVSIILPTLTDDDMLLLWLLSVVRIAAKPMMTFVIGVLRRGAMAKVAVHVVAAACDKPTRLPSRPSPSAPPPPHRDVNKENDADDLKASKHNWFDFDSLYLIMSTTTCG